MIRFVRRTAYVLALVTLIVSPIVGANAVFDRTAERLADVPDPQPTYVTTGPVFRAVDRHGNVASEQLSAGSVARIVKRAAQQAGLNPRVLAGHSLRSGHATTAASRGANDRAIMRQTGHRTRRTLDRYIQDGQLLNDDNSSGKLGL